MVLQCLLMLQIYEVYSNFVSLRRENNFSHTRIALFCACRGGNLPAPAAYNPAAASGCCAVVALLRQIV